MTEIPSEWIQQAQTIWQTYIWSLDNAYQLGLMALAAMLGWLLARPLKRAVAYADAQIDGRWLDVALRAVESIRTPLCIWLIFHLLPFITQELNIGFALTRVIHNLLGAWVVIRFASDFIENPPLARLVAIVAWSIAALNSVGVLGDVIAQLDAIGINLGENRVSLLTMSKGVVVFVLVVWGANALARLSEKQVQRMTQITPSLRVLINKIIRVSFVVFAILIGLNTLGIDLTSLAVFSGAVGVGLGFGLQKVVSNFISGIILLLDRSIKPGDVIAINDTYGWVNKLSARHASVITRDGKEHLIPNELLITERVENWSYSDRNIRLRIPVGVSYDADPRKAMQQMKQAAAECPRVLKTPEPRALMVGFGDSSVDLELRCWIDDPANGIRNVTSEVLLLIWDKFHEHGIEIPYPQRDVHIKSGSLD